MAEITDHHDGHGLTEQIHVYPTDEIGPGGAHHRYEFTVDGEVVGFLQFQRGPRDAPDSVPGLLTGAVLAALIDISRDFQSGPFPSTENAGVLTSLQTALALTKARAHSRAQRGVLGSNRA